MNGSSWRQLGKDVARAVLRSVVDDDELDPERHGEDAPDDLVDRVALVVDGHDDRESGSVRAPFNRDISRVLSRSRAGAPRATPGRFDDRVESSNCGVQPSSCLMRALDANRTAGSPGAAGPTVHADGAGR